MNEKIEAAVKAVADHELPPVDLTPALRSAVVIAADGGWPSNIRAGSIGQWTTAKVLDRHYMAHLSIVVDPATPEKVEKYIAVIYLEPNAGARYVRGESLWSFEEALARVAELMPSVRAPEEY